MSRIHRSVDFATRIFLLLIVCGPTLRAQRPTAAEVTFAFERSGLQVPKIHPHGRPEWPWELQGRPNWAGGSRRFGAACDRGL